MNMSMGDYIRHQRMERACQMLREGNNVSETAYATGFTDPNYFSKIFKKLFGKTPTEYISQSNKWLLFTAYMCDQLIAYTIMLRLLLQASPAILL